jgi:large subunit ribosomal protein L15
MKLHDLQPADGARLLALGALAGRLALARRDAAAGARRPRVRVGRGIAAGKGKTAGKGTKGQKARAGGSIPAWFEGGQTPLHQRIPKLRGFRNPFKIDYEVVNVGRISAYAEADRFMPGELAGGKKGAKAPITVNQEILHAAGLVSSLKKPLKILGHGDVTVALFIVADAFTRSAVAKIEAAGGTAQALEVPTGPLAALGLDEAEVVEVVEVVEVEKAPAKKARAPKATVPVEAVAVVDAEVADVAPEAQAVVESAGTDADSAAPSDADA